ncbi:MAG: hypothetical protein IJR89_05255 [Clostridia bacterium]|nr:hypothetical protein [Clostridia bacterium]
MKKIGFLFLFSFLMFLFFAFPAGAAGTAEVVYLKNGGTGDGSSPEAALGSMKDAYAALDLKKACTIVVCGEYTQSKTFQHTAAYGGSVTLTSVWDGVDYRKTAGAVYITGEFRYVCTGAVTVRDMDYHLTGKYYFVIAQHYPFVLDTGVRMVSENAAFDGSAVGNAFTILAGYQSGQTTVDGGKNPPTAVSKNASVTVRSGSNLVIAAFSRQIKNQKLTGTSTVTVEGNAEVGILYYAPIGAAFDVTAKAVVNVWEHAKVEKICGGTSKGTLDSVTLNWLSGEIGEFSPAGGGAETSVKNGYQLTFSDVSAAKETFSAVTKLFKNKEQVSYDLPPAPETDPLLLSVKVPRTEPTLDMSVPGETADPSSSAFPAWAIPVAAAAVAAAVVAVILIKKKKA